MEAAAGVDAGDGVADAAMWASQGKTTPHPQPARVIRPTKARSYLKAGHRLSSTARLLRYPPHPSSAAKRVLAMTTPGTKIQEATTREAAAATVAAATVS